MKTPHGKGPATDLLKQIFDHVLEIRRIRGQGAEDIKAQQAIVATTRKRLAADIMPHAQFIRDGLTALTQWYRLNLDRYGHGRQIKLPSGTISARISSHFKVEITGEKEDVIARVADLGDEFIIITRTLNHDAIAAQRDLFRGVKGIKISLKDNFSVESDVLELTDDEHDMLRAGLKTWINPRGNKPSGRRSKETG